MLYGTELAISRGKKENEFENVKYKKNCKYMSMEKCLHFESVSGLIAFLFGYQYLIYIMPGRQFSTNNGLHSARF